jgi:glutamine amidotransferase/cyclase
MITLLDYGAGNVRSVRNAVNHLGAEIVDVTSPQDIIDADKLIFPGVGSFGLVMQRLRDQGYTEPLIKRIEMQKPFLGICVALQALFEQSEESPGVRGLGIIRGAVTKFPDSCASIPHMGWNGLKVHKACSLLNQYQDERMYFVHSYCAAKNQVPDEWLVATTDYGEEFVSALGKENILALQFHPEKSGGAGLQLLKTFIQPPTYEITSPTTQKKHERTTLAKRIIACLDVRSDDHGELVVTKGDQYDVREQGAVRNLGRPAAMAHRYYEEGADEITFLNITGFRDFPLADQPMLRLLEETSKQVFVPLTIGGGIRGFTDENGVEYSALEVASTYFRSGADKVSIGGDAVSTVEKFLASGTASGKSSIEQISGVYGAQAVVISVDPRRVYVSAPDETHHATIETADPGPNGECYCWYQCTVKGGREGRDLDVIQLVSGCEALGAGEILLNCIDRDGSKNGFDLELIKHVQAAVSIPVIASSGAGAPVHFSDVFVVTDVEAALAAGIFHRDEVSIEEVKQELINRGIVVRL